MSLGGCGPLKREDLGLRFGEDASMNILYDRQTGANLTGFRYASPLGHHGLLGRDEVWT